MKKIILTILVLCFCSFSNANTLTYPAKTVLVKKGLKIYFLKKAAKGVLVGGSVAGVGYLGYKAYKSSGLNDYIAKTMVKDRPERIIKEQINDRIKKDLNNPKKNKIDIIMEAKEELRYYIIRYQNTKYSQMAIDIANIQGFNDSSYKKELDTDLKSSVNIMARMEIISNKIKKYQNNCNTTNRDEIKQSKRKTDYTNIHKPTEEGDTGAYKDLGNNSITDNRENDHIPSKATVIQYIRNRDNNGKKLNLIIEGNIAKNASAVNILKNLHHLGRTHSDSYLIPIDALDLSVTTMRDFAWHYINSGYQPFVLVAMEKVYLRNYLLCLYE